jgi:arsenate reductase
MAEAWLRRLGGDTFDVYSAGTEPRVVHPLAIKAMAEVGIDISGQRAKAVDEFVELPFDFVITLCDDARESCPFFAGATQRLHWSFPDPSVVEGTDEERLDFFREVRDGIRSRIEEFVSAQKRVK